MTDTTSPKTRMMRAEFLAGSRIGQVAEPATTRMMRAEAVAEFTGLSASYLAKLRVTGFGPPFKKIGRAVIYRQSDVEAWLDNHNRTSTSDKGGAK